MRERRLPHTKDLLDSRPLVYYSLKRCTIHLQCTPGAACSQWRLSTGGEGEDNLAWAIKVLSGRHICLGAGGMALASKLMGVTIEAARSPKGAMNRRFIHVKIPAISFEAVARMTPRKSQKSPIHSTNKLLVATSSSLLSTAGS
jgi:hypothetical protein